MRVVLQRVKRASVSIDGQKTGEIGNGLLLLVGFKEGDGQKEIAYLAHKVANVRIFSDNAGKMNLSVKQVAGGVLSISQFTLYAATRKGNRPSFTEAQDPKVAAKNYQLFDAALRTEGLDVAEGVFGANMQVELVNDGPVTIIYDTENNH
ncbi:D-tyrosyl-tRNA deacylase [Liquorilactobacillus sucicola DSM 21376 = JCM 15457]|uniref:D-aminoacyl-tRNA deacylase n=1 Tax=Liquorilactobacillus sucicola DSM 21376 = JCM 15457 TaxID=1423806 RepID=A0A023CUA8_9LACO|nr:D-aminoacyl-tRNA deacylase [Liquorilactobacillus sucicola]KRN05400.1 D-tyrosyl-tRNA(Tyr) deacylase [Liquorilactobacillus sucicola DSM 21376 = JCM 15457]GAJ25473.1 D-tyrosyl-tRNA deacylase [Liquorilactobacillus sucicola DSM 21376 = JCM 15457]